MTIKKPVVIGDIGGTNARFALVDLAQANNKQTPLYTQQITLSSKDYPNFAEAIADYFAQIPCKPQQACFAMAGPVLGDNIKMTNNHWQFSKAVLQQRFNLARLAFINDFQAPAFAIPEFQSDDIVNIGGVTINPNLAHDEDFMYGIIGPGTGTGVGGLLQAHTIDGRFQEALNTEGGHVSFAPTSRKQIQILEVLMERFERVSIERLLSGMGIHNLYEALCRIEGQEPENLDIVTIVQRGINNQSRLCRETLLEFCAILGAQAGDLALTLGARAGVYIAGGIVPRFTEFLINSPFRKAFEAKGRHTNYVKAIPTYVITAEQPGLMGTAAYVNSHFQPV